MCVYVCVCAWVGVCVCGWVGVQVLVHSGRTVYFWQRDRCSRWLHKQTVHTLQIFHTAVASDLDAEAGLRRLLSLWVIEAS